MPAPQATLLKQLVRLKFTSFAIKVPTNWQQPSGDKGSAFNDAFSAADKASMPGSPPLFLPASFNKVHCDTQKQHVRDYGDFIDTTCDAICSAWGMWQSAAALTGVVVNAAVAMGGAVVGPPLMPLILKDGKKETPNLLKYTNAIATAIGNGWLQYTATIKVGGMPWYPAFAALPSPMAPPTPNIPCPVAALIQVPVSMSAQMLKMSMIQALGDPQAPHADKLFEAIADGVEKVFNMWKVSTMVTQILGTGPVPTFAPPYVPVGPVLGGVANGAPGCFT